MDDKLKKLFDDFEEEDFSKRDNAEVIKEKLWNRLAINKQQAKVQKSYWPHIAAILFLLLMGALYCLWFQNKKSQKKLEQLQYEYAQTIDELNQNQQNLSNELLALRKNNLTNSKNDQQHDKSPTIKQELKIKYIDRVENIVDTIYLAAEKQIEYRERIIRDTILIEKKIVAEEPMASQITKETKDKKTDYPKAVYYDLRTKTASPTKTKSSIIITAVPEEGQIKNRIIKTRLKQNNDD